MPRPVARVGTALAVVALALGCCQVPPALAAGDGSSISSQVSTSGGTTKLTVQTPGDAGQQTSYDGQSSAAASASAQAAAQAAQLTCQVLSQAVTNAGGGANAATAQQMYQASCAAGTAPKTFVNPAVLGRQAVLRLTVPSAVPSVGPPPDVNQWKMLPVGFPIWLWVTGATTLSTSITVQGYPVALRAVRQSVHFDMGDGTGALDCGNTTPWVMGTEGGVPSPDCGYTYQVPSQTQANPSATYLVTATATWAVTWSVLGQSGTIQVQRAAGSRVPIGELQALITGR